MRFETLRDIDFAGFDVRIWCFRCARGTIIDGMVWEAFLKRGWPIDLDAATRHFRCRTCGRHDQVRLLPTRRQIAAPRNWADEVAGYFHGNRKRAKIMRP